MDEQVEYSDDEKSMLRKPSEYREDLFNTLCGDGKTLTFAASVLPPKAQCPVCSKWFRDKTRVHEHLNVHYGARPLYCNVCGTTFAARSNLIKHAQQHQAPFSCYVCGHGPYADARQLTEHTRNQHEELHRFACHLCHLSFPRQADLSDHLVTHPPTFLEVRRRKRGAPDSPVDLSTDGEETVPKRPHAFPHELPPEQDSDRVSNQGDFPLDKSQADYAASALFALDPVAMKHASMEELASHISKLTNFAANLHQNGMLHALANGGSFLSLPPFANPQAAVQQHQQPPQQQAAVKHESNGFHGSSNGHSVTVNAKSEANSTSQSQSQSQSQQSKLPSILLRKQSSVHSNSFSQQQNNHQNNQVELSLSTVENGVRNRSDSRPNSLNDSLTHSANASKRTEIGTQCSLLDEQSGLLCSGNVPPCQRDIMVFQQLLAKLVSRGDVFRCQHCEIIFFERGIYSLHRSLHDEQNPFQCAICGTRCSNKDNFTLHFINQKHQNGGCTGACIKLPAAHDADLQLANGK